jgi:diguanylate cyclase (GGDEF)-like protein/PAS domain S-box-containing protein
MKSKLSGNSTEINKVPTGELGINMTRQIIVAQSTSSLPARVGSAFTISPVVMMVRISVDEKILDANDAFVQLLGLPLQNLLGKNICKYFNFKNPADHKQLINSVIKENYFSTHLELVFVDGTHRWFTVMIQVLPDTQNSEIQIIGTELIQSLRVESVHHLQLELLNSSDLDEAELTHLFVESVVKMGSFVGGALLMPEGGQKYSILRTVGSNLVFEEANLSDQADLKELLRQSPRKVTHFLCTEHPLLARICDLTDAADEVIWVPVYKEDRPHSILILCAPAGTQVEEDFVIQLQSLVSLLEVLLFNAREKRKVNLKETELQNIFRSISEMLLLIDETGLIIEANPALVDRLNLHTKNPRQIFELHPPEAKEKLQQAFAQLDSQGKLKLQLPLLVGTGEPILTELEMVKGLWQERSVIICLYRDIHHQQQVEELEQERRKMADAFAESALVLNSSLNQDEVLAHILDMVVKVVPNAYTNIAVLEGAKMHVVASRGYEKLGVSELLHSRVMNADKIQNLDQMIRTKKECLIAETKNNPQWVSIPETMWINSYIGAPIVVNGEVYGFINCDSEIPGYFNESDAVNLKLFADQAAIAIENARLHQEVEQHLRKITQITELTRTVLVSSNVREVTQRVVSPLLKLFHANSIFISQWDAQKRIAFCLSAQGDGIVPDYPKFTLTGWATLTEFVLSQKQALILKNGQESEEINLLIGRLFTDGYILALPMWVEENPFGVIFLGFNHREQISEDDLAIGAFAANQLATAIQKTMMLESEQSLTQQYSHANELLTSLSQVAASLNSSAGPQGVMETMGDGLEKLHIHSMVFLLDDDLAHVHLEYSSRQSDLAAFTQKLEQEYLFDRFKVDHTPEYERVILQKRSVFTPDITALFYKILPPELGPFMYRILDILGVGAKSKALLVPLLSENKTVGVLNIYGEELMEIDQKAGETFGGQISAAFENAILLSKVQRLAVTDELTGIYNRRGLIEKTTNLFKTARRFERTLSVLMLDLDDFKSINDQFGHDIGDDVLKGFVQQVKANIREIDLLARYGGEEFVVVLEESDKASSMATAERICRFIAAHPIRTSHRSIKITVSIGVAELLPEMDSVDTLIKQADRSLYLAKNRGKNQVASITG